MDSPLILSDPLARLVTLILMSGSRTCALRGKGTTTVEKNEKAGEGAPKAAPAVTPEAASVVARPGTVLPEMAQAAAGVPPAVESEAAEPDASTASAEATVPLATHEVPAAAATDSPRRNAAFVTTGIVVGSLVVAGPLFGGGVALGANLPGAGHRHSERVSHGSTHGLSHGLTHGSTRGLSEGPFRGRFGDPETG